MDVYLYVLSNFYYDILDSEKYIPCVDGTEVSADSVYINENGGESYTIITALEIDNPKNLSTNINILTGSDLVYVSQKNIYILEQDKTKSETEKGNQLTEIYLDREKNEWIVNIFEFEEENRVYTLDEELNVMGEIKGIAGGEDLYSARFMGNIGYFVTFETIDPLFAVDFSDPENPKIISELKVPGFSEYLHFWEENKLLGIGFDTEERDGGVRTIGYKLSMFDISDPKNVTEEKMESKRNRYTNTWDYKSILILREKNVIGFEVWSDYGYPGYVVYSYDENQGFSERFKFDMELEDLSGVRGIIINDVLYLILGNRGINTYDISQDYKIISEMKY